MSKTLTKGPWTATLSDGNVEDGYTVHVSHADMGDMYLVDEKDCLKLMSKEASDRLWDLIDEEVFRNLRDGTAAIRAWFKMLAVQ